MLEVFFLTLFAVSTLLIYISIGYFLRRHHDLPDDAGHVLSLLCTLVFSPSYSIINLSKNFTADVIGEKMVILGYGVVFVAVAFGLAFLLSKPFCKDKAEHSSLIYAFSIPNYGYFGYPVIQAVFGDAVLADVMVFLIPLSFATTSIGYVLFMSGKRIPWRTILLPHGPGCSDRCRHRHFRHRASGSGQLGADRTWQLYESCIHAAGRLYAG